MIKHMICYKLKENTDEVRERARKTLLSMRTVVQEALDIEVGFDFLHSERSFDMVLIVTLRDREALMGYANNDYHCSVVKPYMHSIMSQSIAIDYEY